MMRVSGLLRVGLQVTNLNQMRDFYHRNWGMALINDDGQEVAFRCQESRKCDLLLRAGSTDGLDHVAFAVASEDEMMAILENLESHGHSIQEKPRPGRHTGDDLVASFLDPDRNRVELVVPTQIDGEAGFEVTTTGPLKLGHVVLWTPRQADQEAFYSLLGFRVSDRTQIGMSFLRCNHDHHSLAFVKNAGERTGLQHLAFDVGSLDTVMLEAARMRDEGNPCIWGVGRHGPGNNIFSYYQDPAGNVIEYYSDMELVTDTQPVQERFWGPEHNGDVWGLSGPPPEPFLD